MQIIANHAPIGFEAEFLSHRGINTLYRGILMPLSTDGDQIDFIYGVINWKELADNGTATGLAGEVDRAIASVPERGDLPVWADGPHAELSEDGAAAEPGRERDDRTLSLWPEGGDGEVVTDSLPDGAGLADWLDLARSSAEQARSSDHRSRNALYRALGHAYDFALAAETAPDDFAELLDDAGLKVQQRAPMTPVVKLVFGAEYDKTRLTEFAAALSWARRSEIESGGFANVLERFDGGLKAVVAAERAARRPAEKPNLRAERRARFAAAPALALIEGVDAAGAGEGELILLVARCDAAGRIAIVAPAVRDARLVDSAIARAGA
jgi:microcompartment protein CcmK/EutM